MKEKAGEKAENGTMMRQSCISGRAMHFMGVMPGQRYAGAGAGLFVKRIRDRRRQLPRCFCAI